MKRALPLVALAALAVPAIAAAVQEIGPVDPAVRGVCPKTCFAITRTTGYQAKVGPDRSAYRAPADGRIVAWTIALGNPGPKQTAFFSDRYGGVASATIVVLDPAKKLNATVVAKAPLQRLNGYFGQTITFPLETTLAIKKGQLIGLNVPSWVPALQIGLGSDTSWRSSRAATGCTDSGTQSALVGRTSFAQFRCLYKGVRLTYSATFIPSPPPPGPGPKVVPPPTATTTTPTTTIPAPTTTIPPATTPKPVTPPATTTTPKTPG